jgi:hypothetical protein
LTAGRLNKNLSLEELEEILEMKIAEVGQVLAAWKNG